MLDLVVGSAAGLALATVGLALYSAGALHRFRRLTVMRDALEAHCATLRDEVETREALDRELAKVTAERVALQEAQSQLQQEEKAVRESAEQRALAMAESLVAQHTAAARALEEKAREREKKAAEWEARAQKKAQEGVWIPVRQYSAVAANEVLAWLNAQVESTLALFWEEDKAKGKTPRPIMLRCQIDTYPTTVTQGTCEFRGRSWEEWKAYRAREDKRSWIEGKHYYTLFHYRTQE